MNGKGKQLSTRALIQALAREHSKLHRDELSTHGPQCAGDVAQDQGHKGIHAAGRLGELKQGFLLFAETVEVVDVQCRLNGLCLLGAA